MRSHAVPAMVRARRLGWLLAGGPGSRTLPTLRALRWRVAMQVQRLEGDNARLREALGGKEAALMEAYALIKDLQAQLAVPSANRDPDAAGRVRAQVRAWGMGGAWARAPPCWVQLEALMSPAGPGRR